MQKVAVYLRVSTAAQDFEMQKHRIDAWYDGLAVKPNKFQIFQDHAKTGSNLNRPSFKKMVRQALAGDFDTIVCYRLDRFSRSTIDAIETIIKLDRAGVAFIAIDQPALNLGHEVPFRTAILAIFAELAEIERNTIVARVRAGLDAAKKRGVVLGAPVKLRPEQVAEIGTLRGQGMTIRNIAKAVGLSRSKVHVVLKSCPIQVLKTAI